MKDEPMVNMFRMLETSGMLKFLGYSSKVSEPMLDELFASSKIEHGFVAYTIKDSNIIISHKMFCRDSDHSSNCLCACYELPEENASQRRIKFSVYGDPLSSPTCLKKDIKV